MELWPIFFLKMIFLKKNLSYFALFEVTCTVCFKIHIIMNDLCCFYVSDLFVKETSLIAYLCKQKLKVH